MKQETMVLSIMSQEKIRERIYAIAKGEYRQNQHGLLGHGRDNRAKRFERDIRNTAPLIPTSNTWLMPGRSVNSELVIN
jgi:hypothetical protein